MLASSSSPPPSPLTARFSVSTSPQKAMRFVDVANIFVKMRKTATTVKSTSGDPQTHPGIQLTCERKVPLDEEERFVCRDGVDTMKLLRAARTTLYEKAEALGANVLVDEQWSCAISGPRRDGSYRVLIRYSACASRSSVADPQKPVGLENARCVPGLMTILSRDE
ncbi:hypothetical protein EUX98_g1409 [Antrodiella citrinella]|uniref:Uncharacterized protein n=1 Tax=Antrodiella citrinella TaxID=2447956 RepID=A0A4S4N1I7_9APHY|nr:hypothetical protein EUX98_g1409 [Antrodiella citrinella]